MEYFFYFKPDKLFLANEFSFQLLKMTGIRETGKYQKKWDRTINLKLLFGFY